MRCMCVVCGRGRLVSERLYPRIYVSQLTECGNVWPDGCGLTDLGQDVLLELGRAKNEVAQALLHRPVVGVEQPRL